jgi:hypothetical protein
VKGTLTKILFKRKAVNMRGKNHLQYVLVIFTLCFCFLLSLATIADVHGETFVTCNTIAADSSLYPGNIKMPGDVNCFSFTATAGDTYVIETNEFSAECDTIIHLYHSDGTIEIDGNDNSGTSLASKIEWTASSSGSYYVMVELLDSTSGTISYKISIR